MVELEPTMIYASQMRQACARLKAALRFHHAYETDREVPSLDAAVLQIRKALELIAFAAVAPDKEAFAKLRATDDGGDFTRDYHARRILTALGTVFPDFYPLALTEPVEKDGVIEFGRKENRGYLTRSRFEKVYDRLGKHLHAENPWGADPNLQNLAKDMPGLVEEIYQLLDLHARFIKSPTFFGAWVVRVDRNGGPPQLIQAGANGDFVDTMRKPNAKG